MLGVFLTYALLDSPRVELRSRKDSVFCLPCDDFGWRRGDCDDDSRENSKSVELHFESLRM
jgi:hypothetical protein